MDLATILKQLKHITPNPTYTAISKQAVLGRIPRNLRRWEEHVLRIVGSSTVFALLSIALVVLFGGLSLFLEPRTISEALDPITLRAEAEAIDIQIHLTNLSYAEPTSTPGVTTISEAPSIPQKLKQEVTERAGNLGVPLSDALDPKQEPTIDEVLEALTH